MRNLIAILARDHFTHEERPSSVLVEQVLNSRNLAQSCDPHLTVDCFDAEHLVGFKLADQNRRVGRQKNLPVPTVDRLDRCLGEDR